MRYCFPRFPEGKFKALTLSYDDGVQADIRLAELTHKHGIKCTFNVNGSSMCGGMRISTDTIKEKVVPYGHEIAVHGANHIAPGVAAPGLIIKDMLMCRLELEEAFGTIIRGMAYPDSGIRRMENGNSYENIRQYLSDIGIVYGRSAGGDNDCFMLPNDFLNWMPTAHHKNSHLDEYADKFLATTEEGLYGSHRFPRLFYLWGHSYEFDRDDNWEIIERFCEKMGGHDDIWYATNIEIYEYIEAYRRLVPSADHTKYYNPTNTTVWINVDGNTKKIEPGQTVSFVG